MFEAAFKGDPKTYLIQPGPIHHGSSLCCREECVKFGIEILSYLFPSGKAKPLYLSLYLQIGRSESGFAQLRASYQLAASRAVCVQQHLAFCNG